MNSKRVTGLDTNKSKVITFLLFVFLLVTVGSQLTEILRELRTAAKLTSERSSRTPWLSRVDCTEVQRQTDATRQRRACVSESGGDVADRAERYKGKNQYISHTSSRAMCMYTVEK